MITTAERLATKPAAQRPAAPKAATRVQPPPVRLKDNRHWAGASPRISVMVAFDGPHSMEAVRAVAALETDDQVELVLYDNGAKHPDLTAQLNSILSQSSTPARIATAGIATGKAQVRNTLGDYCRAEWLLMLEPHSVPADANFLNRYLDFLDSEPAPALVMGGYAPSPAPKNPRCALHHWHAVQFECRRADERSRQPLRHLQIGNALVHKSVLAECRFDELFRGHGWEGVDWGLRVARSFPISHIENPVIRDEFETDVEMLDRYRASAANFARLVAWYPHSIGKSPLVHAALWTRRLPKRNSLIALSRRVALSASLPLGMRRSAFRIWRALTYAGAL